MVSVNDEVVLVGIVRAIDGGNAVIVVGANGNHVLRGEDAKSILKSNIAQLDLTTTQSFNGLIQFLGSSAPKSLNAAAAPDELVRKNELDADQLAQNLYLIGLLSSYVYRAGHDYGDPYYSQAVTALTQVYRHTIAANTLPGRSVRMVLRGTLRQFSGASQNMELVVKLGATTVLQSQMSINNDTDAAPWQMTIEVLPRGDGKQTVTGDMRIGGQFNATAGISNFSSLHRDGHCANHAVTEDDTTALALSFEQRFVSSAANVDFSIYSATVEYV